MADLAAIFKLDPYSVSNDQKRAILVSHLRDLTEHHRSLCETYCKLTDAFGHSAKNLKDLSDFFQLPVQLFKYYDLRSTTSTDLSKTLTSSGTTSSQVSKVFIDSQTTRYQTKALSAIIRSFLGPKRLPMIILDTDSVIKNRTLFSARGGGIIGMSTFGRDHLYLFDDDMKIRHHELELYLQRHKGEKIFLFGFTFMVWRHLICELKKSNIELNLHGATLIHSGGWKKLEAEKVDNTAFKEQVKNATGISNIFNFYGMVEQMGSVYMECEAGHLHASVFSEILVRDPYSDKILHFGETGVIETLSILPYSYPGHVILTEDQGVVHGIDDCQCGRMGTHFSVIGRLPRAEVRGCSDTYETGA